MSMTIPRSMLSRPAVANFNQANSAVIGPRGSNQIRPHGFPPFKILCQTTKTNFNRGKQLQSKQRKQFQPRSIIDLRFHQPVVNQPIAHQGPALRHTVVSKQDFEDMSQPMMQWITTCNTLADLGASINRMPYSVWNNLTLPELTPTCMTLELADRSITKPIGIAEDVFVNVGKFQFPADFVVVDFEPDPRVPLILGRCFLKTSHALIDVYKGEITLRVGKEAITFNLDQTSRYTADYNKIDVVDMACDEYSQEVLGFSNVIASGNPTPYFEPIVSTASPNLTPFGDSDFLLMEEADSFLALEDDPTLLAVYLLK
ncbi:reverse transcriptase domain-containing protein [Tanacetum coccineum]